jgi:hypothetical protein
MDTSNTNETAEQVNRAEDEGHEDAAGFMLATPVAIDRMWQIAPRLALLKTLPDPGPEGKVFNQQFLGK